jgi:hypothetical protein
MEYNDYDSEVSDHLSILLDKTRFITKEILRKGVPLGKLKKKKKYILTGQCRKSSTFKRISIYST